MWIRERSNLLSLKYQALASVDNFLQCVDKILTEISVKDLLRCK